MPEILFTPDEEQKLMDFIAKAEAALEFLPDGAPIPYDIGTGLTFEQDSAIDADDRS